MGARPVLAAVGRAPTAPRAPAIPPSAPRLIEHASAKTVREILPPWEVLEQQLKQRTAAAAALAVTPEQGARDALAEQEAINALWAPAPAAEESVDAPPSGIRVSDAACELELEPDDEAIDEALLSFKVYTIAELEHRSDAPASIRGSRRRSRSWRRVGGALRAFASASLEWLRIKGMRPSPKAALRAPFDALGDELQVLVESVDWQTLGVRIGIVVGATLTLLFGALTIAELTDDLKPAGAASHLASSETSVPSGRTPLDTNGVAPATSMAAQGSQLVAPAPVAVAPPDDATSAGELDEEPPAKKPVKRAAAPAARKTTKLTFRNADAIFQSR